MTSLTLFPGIRDYFETFLGNRAKPEPLQSRAPNRPQSQEERHGMMEEMILTNPALCASELGIQWMYSKYGRN